ncbi:MAG: stage 0 sporulation family protein [Defluviitaleaceae bacterium]|nr:stage 0 sporulation family protein [Defluviitaleaceae bacterium]
MVEIVGIRFRKVGKIYYFDPNGTEPKQGDGMIVETSRGIDFGTCELPCRMVEESTVMAPLRKIVRIATEADLSQQESNKQREKEAMAICAEKIKKHELDMKLIDVELAFDLTKIMFYFTSDGRVDFRELVRDLASVFRMRIELRQIGVRDEAKMLNGVGICGRCLCCATFLSDFQPVSIKMAKEQSLSLNPTKISGICGRLMCCLKYEEETYEELNKNMPSIGDTVIVPEGKGEVQSINVLRQLVKVAVRKKPGDDIIVNTYNVEDIKIVSRKHAGEGAAPGEAINDELKKLID